MLHFRCKSEHKGGEGAPSEDQKVEDKCVENKKEEELLSSRVIF